MEARHRSATNADVYVCFSLLPIQRVTFKYDGSTIVPGEQGAEYQDFIQQCTGRETRLLRGLPVFWNMVNAREEPEATLGAPSAGGTRSERSKASTSLLFSGHPEQPEVTASLLPLTVIFSSGTAPLPPWSLAFHR